MQHGEAVEQSVGGDIAAQVALHQLAALGLEGEIAGVAGADPGLLHGGAGRAEGAREAGVDGGVLPRLPAGRLAVMLGEGPLGRSSREIGEVGARRCRIGGPARQADARPADGRAFRVGAVEAGRPKKRKGQRMSASA